MGINEFIHADPGADANRQIEKRIPLSPGFHAEPGPKPGDLHDIYVDASWLGEGKRAYIGTLSKDAVEAWSRAETGRIAALGVIAGLRGKL